MQLRSGAYSGGQAHSIVREPALVLVALIAIVMPIVSALVYPTYIHHMLSPQAEFSRLIELPFVVSEVAVVLWAGRQGFDLSTAWRALPRDIRIAAGVLLLAIGVSALLISNNFAYSLTHSLIVLIHLVFALAVYHLLALRSIPAPDRIAPLIAVGAIVLVLYTAWWLLTAPPPETQLYGKIEWHAALPGFISVRHFGAWYAGLSSVFALRILFAERDGRIGWDHLFYCLTAAALVWSGTRAGVLALMVVVGIAMLSLRRIPPARNIGHAAILTGFALCLAWIAIPPDDSFRLWNLNDGRITESIDAGRFLAWKLGIERWTDSPLFGWGTGSFLWEVDPGFPHTQPHNVIVQFLISWGIMGAIPAFWLLGRAIRAAHTSALAHREMLPFLGMAYALLLQSLLEGMLHYPRFIGAIIVLLALVIARAHQPGAATTH
ncbi:O-antigen ligase family protein [Citromicrobium bathyomarinum]